MSNYKRLQMLTYLWVIISDYGNITKDVNLYVTENRSNVVIKYSNFCRKNFLAPLDIKLRVLDTCVSSSLIYGCETWGNSNFNNVKTLYRQGLKCALSVRPSVNNEIISVETGEWPLQIRITKQQLKFWLSIQTMLRDDNHYIAKLVRKAENIEIRYIQYYKQLQQTYHSIDRCQNTLENYFRNQYEQKINAESVIDNDSRLGSYLQVNPNYWAKLQKYDGISTSIHNAI